MRTTGGLRAYTGRLWKDRSAAQEPPKGLPRHANGAFAFYELIEGGQAFFALSAQFDGYGDVCSVGSTGPMIWFRFTGTEPSARFGKPRSDHSSKLLALRR
jgi:hypothetical protein